MRVDDRPLAGTTGPHDGQEQPRAVLRAAAGAVLLALAGCSSHVDALGPDVVGSIDARDRYPIEVVGSTAKLYVAPRGRARRLSVRQKDEVAAFIEEFKSHGSGRLVLSRPVGTSNQFVAAGIAAEIERMLDRRAVPRERVIRASYRPRRHQAKAPVRLRFERYHASVPPCGDWSINVAETYENRPYPNLGCATQANIAEMVADKRDLVRPRTMAPPDAARREKIFEDYRKGDITAAKKSEEQKADVSDVSQ